MLNVFRVTNKGSKNIYNEAICENSEQPKAAYCFCKTVRSYMFVMPSL